MANISSGTSLTASSFNNLLSRLEAVRQKHAVDQQNKDQGVASSLSTAFSTSVAVQGNEALSSNVTTLKNSLTTLAKSSWLADDLGSNISATQGALIKASDFNIWDNTVTNVEAVCPNYGKYNQYSKYGQYGAYGAYSVYSHYDYTAYSNYYQYSNYSQNN